MNALISLGFLFVSVLHAGGFMVLSAWGSDLKVTLENEVAGVIPDMEILPSGEGALAGNGNMEVAANSGHHSQKKNPDYFSRKKIFAEKKYANAGFITPDLVPVGTITKLFEQKLGTTGPDEIFVDIGKRQGIETGDRFTVYSRDRYIYHPVLPGRMFEKLGEYTRRTGFGHKVVPHPGKPLGHRVLIHGVIEITDPGDKFSHARVVKAYEGIEPGHLLTPYKKFEDQAVRFRETDKSLEGYIVASKGDKIGISGGDIVYIDKGWEDRVRPGDRFEVYTVPQVEESAWYRLEPKRTPLLPFVRGEIEIIDTQKKTATAVVMKNRIDMEVGNPIRYKRSDHPG
jgi:hypothetical protein